MPELNSNGRNSGFQLDLHTYPMEATQAPTWWLEQESDKVRMVNNYNRHKRSCPCPREAWSYVHVIHLILEAPFIGSGKLQQQTINCLVTEIHHDKKCFSFLIICFSTVSSETREEQTLRWLTFKMGKLQNTWYYLASFLFAKSFKTLPPLPTIEPRPCLFVCIIMCLSVFRYASHISETSGAIAITFDTVTASIMWMQHTCITFFFTLSEVIQQSARICR